MKGLNSENVNYVIIVQYYVVFSSFFSQICLLCESIRSVQGRLGSESILSSDCANSLSSQPAASAAGQSSSAVSTCLHTVPLAMFTCDSRFQVLNIPV